MIREIQKSKLLSEISKRSREADIKKNSDQYVDLCLEVALDRIQQKHDELIHWFWKNMKNGKAN